MDEDEYIEGILDEHDMGGSHSGVTNLDDDDSLLPPLDEQPDWML